MNTPARIWERYVAIGDSFTEGMSDPSTKDPDVYVGWADRLASHLAERNTLQGKPFGYANLAIRGRLIADVAGPQVNAALELQPDLVSIVGGGNDIIRPKVDLDDVADLLESAVAKLRATGCDVLMATSADPGWAPLFKYGRGRFGAHNANVWGIAQRHGCYVLDQWSLRSLRDTRMWAQDRLHMTTEGHVRVAEQAGWTLGLASELGSWREPLPAAPPLSRRESAQEHAAWARTHLTPWVQRRVQGRSSGDGRAPKRPSVEPIAGASTFQEKP